jgi:hypothetical protein
MVSPASQRNSAGSPLMDVVTCSFDMVLFSQF